MKLQQGDVILTKVDYELKGEKLNHMTLAEGGSYRTSSFNCFGIRAAYNDG